MFFPGQRLCFLDKHGRQIASSFKKSPFDPYVFEYDKGRVYKNISAELAYVRSEETPLAPKIYNASALNGPSVSFKNTLIIVNGKFRGVDEGVIEMIKDEFSCPMLFQPKLIDGLSTIGLNQSGQVEILLASKKLLRTINMGTTYLIEVSFSKIIDRIIYDVDRNRYLGIPSWTPQAKLNAIKGKD
jgi:hypothetical protein